MYKELAKDIKGFEHPGHGNLTGWAKQGMFIKLVAFKVCKRRQSWGNFPCFERFDSSPLGVYTSY